MPINRLNPGYKQEPPSGRVIDSKIYVGIVKNNVDVQNMGRLQVWIPEIGGDPDRAEHWYIVSYASPFAGATDFNGIVKGGKQFGQSQESYGFWFVPPDLNNHVLVTFINGEASRGFWFACLYQQYANHMVPGIPVNISTEPDKGGHCGSYGAVTEYNKWDDSLKPPDPPRPPFPPLNTGLCNEGLFSDPSRGPSNSGAQRESPSQVFGIKTPRGQHFVMDDNQSNEFIRIRTRGGTQILVHETTGFVYINSKNGNSWLEVSDDGIDLYSQNYVSIRAAKDINLHADGKINLNGSAGIFMHTNAGQDMRFTSGGGVHVLANQGLFAQSNQGIDVKATNALHLQSASEIDLKSLGLVIDSSAGINLSATGNIVRTSGGKIFDNTLGATGAPDAAAAIPVADHPLPDVVPGNCCGTETSTPTIVSRLPTHEPFKGHPTNVARPPRVTHPAIIVPDQILDDAGSGGGKGGSIGAGGGAVVKTSPGQDTTVSTTPPTQTTGSGANRVVPIDPNSLTTEKIANSNVRVDVVNAIRQASDITGVRFGYLMAIAQIESSFNPNAQAKTSSALGLYQFLTGTWNQMINTKDATGQTYGELYGIGPDDRTDPRASAIIGGLYTEQNSNYLAKRINRDPTNTDLYIAHFLGAGGAVKFLTADQNADAAQLMGAAVANANAPIFFDKTTGQSRTVADVYTRFAAKIEPQSLAYQQAFGEISAVS